MIRQSENSNESLEYILLGKGEIPSLKITNTCGKAFPKDKSKHKILILDFQQLYKNYKTLLNHY